MAQRDDKKSEIGRQIIERSIPLFEKHGYQDSTVRDICKNAGITTGMFYRHFKSKEDLASYCFIHSVDEMVRGVGGALADKPLPEQLVIFFFELVKCNRILGSDGIFVLIGNEKFQCDCSAVRDRIYEAVERYVRIAAANGHPINRDPREIANDLLTVEKGLVFECYTRGDAYDLLAQARPLFERVIDGVLR